MSSIHELEKRVTKVETGLQEVRTLAAGASEDVSNYQAALKGHTTALNALRKTQLDQGELLAKLAAAVEKQGELLGKHGDVLVKQGSVLVKQGAVLVKQGAVVETLASEMRTMRETQFQHAVDMRTMRETQNRHHIDQQGYYAEIKAEVTTGINRVVRLIERSGGADGNTES